MSQCLPPPPLRPVASGFSAHSPFICVGDYVKSKVGPDTVPDADPLPSVRLVSPRQREVDISSEANFLASFHQSAGGCDPRAATPGPPCAIMGTVTSVAYGRGTATVAVWKRGEDFLVDRRPAIVYPLRALKRITAKEFARDCGRPYLRHKERSMAAAAAGGDDEATPASLAVHYASVLIAVLNRAERRRRVLGEVPADANIAICDELSRTMALDVRMRRSPKGRPPSNASGSTTHHRLNSVPPILDSAAPGLPRAEALVNSTLPQIRPTSSDGKSLMLPVSRPTTGHMAPADSRVGRLVKQLTAQADQAIWIGEQQTLRLRKDGLTAPSVGDDRLPPSPASQQRLVAANPRRGSVSPYGRRRSIASASWAFPLTS